jgi:hypothetical protein
MIGLELLRLGLIIEPDPGNPHEVEGTLNGIQMDETALPILLVDQARGQKALATGDGAGFWPMVRKAAASTGPMKARPIGGLNQTAAGGKK